ncbi:hypothetical protein ABZY83_26365 [Streptomyces virginiae]|uniref:AlbA family DNA-binding domain-containing protein n=1 Tax=Streptomyces virginiae TaxID=1961 RepID=UPI00339FC8B1
MALSYDQSKAAIRLDKKQELVAAVYQAGPSDEVGWLEWKSTLDLTQRHAFFTIARALLGFANRMPDQAQRFAEGHGYLLVGVEPGKAQGVQEIDSVELYRGLEAYLGRGVGPLWQPTFVPVDLGQGVVKVLLVDVEPPRWGDPVHVLRKGYDAVPATTVFVRYEGRTERAAPEDMDSLSERARRTRQAVKLDLITVAGTPLQSIDSSTDARNAWLAAETQRCEASLQAAPASASPSSHDERDTYVVPTNAQPKTMEEIVGSIRKIADSIDPRSEQQYREEVAQHISRCAKQLTAAVQKTARVRLTPLVLRLVNRTDLNLKNVEVRLYIPGEVEAAHPPKPLAANESVTGLPARPIPFGSARRRSLLDNALGGLNLQPPVTSFLGAMPLAAANPYRPEIVNGGSSDITFPLGHIRPRGSSESDPIIVLVHAPADATITATWSATCSNHDTVVTGTLSLPVADEALSLSELLSEPNSQPDR